MPVLFWSSAVTATLFGALLVWSACAPRATAAKKGARVLVMLAGVALLSGSAITFPH